MCKRLSCSIASFVSQGGIETLILSFSSVSLIKFAVDDEMIVASILSYFCILIIRTAQTNRKGFHIYLLSQFIHICMLVQNL